MSKNIIARIAVIAAIVGVMVLTAVVASRGSDGAVEIGTTEGVATEPSVNDTMKGAQTEPEPVEATPDDDESETGQELPADDSNDSREGSSVAGDQGYVALVTQKTLQIPEYHAMQKEASSVINSNKESTPADGSGSGSNSSGSSSSEGNAASAPETSDAVDHDSGEGTQVTVPNVEDSLSGGLTASQRSAIVAAAYSQVGLPYGHDNIAGVNWDSSGLVAYAYACAGIEVSTNCINQIRMIQNTGNLQPGDVIGWLGSVPGNFSEQHVALYVGDGMILHANGSRVAVESLGAWSPYTNGGPLV